MAQAKTAQILAHWDTLLNVQIAPLAFYDLVERDISSQGFPELKVTRVLWREGGLFSAQREYLRVKRKTLVFDICAAPLGNNFFVAWWLGETTPGVADLFMEIPLIGTVLKTLFRPATYYKVDTTTAFQHTVHNAVLAVVDNLTEKNGLEPLSSDERIPILENFYNW